MTCPNCERYKESAKNWRHKAYELSGHPLPWDRGDTWVGLTETEKEMMWDEAVEGREHFCSQYGDFADAIEAKLKEKNT